MSKKAVTYLVVVFIALALLLHYPFLAIVNKPFLISGIPIFFIYLMIIWSLLVVICFFIVRKGNSEDNHGH